VGFRVSFAGCGWLACASGSSALAGVRAECALGVGAVGRGWLVWVCGADGVRGLGAVELGWGLICF
jgi:hypothetical protein